MKEMWNWLKIMQQQSEIKIQGVQVTVYREMICGSDR
jgi:hypothetical protein